MNKNRRDFLKVAGISLATASLSSASASDMFPSPQRNSLLFQEKKNTNFNMCGYAAPKLETVRIGIIGIGGRGIGAVGSLGKIEGVSINALGDLRAERVNLGKEKLSGTKHNPVLYSGDKDAWKKLCERDDIDLIYITTNWALHAPIAVYAMEQGKHVATEIPAARTIEECWQLVETSEKTKKHCIILENVCYGEFELLTLNMARRGLFGDIIHCEGAYIHSLVEGLFLKDHRWNNWRLRENYERNGNLYPPHGLGPLSQIMNLNRGDKMEYLSSLSSDDFTMGKKAKEMADKDDFFKQFLDKPFRGNMNTSIIRTNKGKSIMLQHDISSPRKYSRAHLISGTGGMAQLYPLPGKISIKHESGSNHGEWLDPEEYKAFKEKYTHPLWGKMGKLATEAGGHGGMDFLIQWRIVDCLRRGLPMDIDVYDAALWSSITSLSEWSVANRSNSVDVPDFTRGGWKDNQPLNNMVNI